MDLPFREMFLLSLSIFANAKAKDGFSATINAVFIAKAERVGLRTLKQNSLNNSLITLKGKKCFVDQTETKRKQKWANRKMQIYFDIWIKIEEPDKQDKTF